MSEATNKRLLVLTGDHSADMHAAAFIAALRDAEPGWRVAGVGGLAMAAAPDVELISDHREMNVIGLGVFKAVPSHLKLGRKILDWVDANKPAVAVLVDYGVFHLWLAPKLRQRGVKVLYFIPPQIWASRPWRLKKLKRAADEVLCILPFEEPYYRRHGIPATFVGNPLASRLPPAVSKEQFARKHGLDAAKPLIGMFPGSRRMEIEQLLANQVGAAKLLESRHPGKFQFAMSRAANLKAKGDLFDRAFEAAGGKQLASLHVVEENHALLSACDLALVKSGTVTLEATLYHTPMVVMYKGPLYTYLAARALMTVKHISLPNNLAGNRLVPELWQYEANPSRIADETERLLEPAAHAKMKRDLATLASTFANAQTPKRVAEAIVRLAEVPEERGSVVASREGSS